MVLTGSDIAVHASQVTAVGDGKVTTQRDPQPFNLRLEVGQVVLFGRGGVALVAFSSKRVRMIHHVLTGTYEESAIFRTGMGAVSISLQAILN